MSNPVTAGLLLGSNLGDRPALLRAARAALAATAGDIVAASALYETAAWGREDQPAFLNQALIIRTDLPAEALLAQCLAAERQAGRQRLEHWGSRTLDIDILLYSNEIINQPHMIIPHPRLAERRFALVPLAEIAEAMRHPGLGLLISELLAQCPDPLPVRRWSGEEGAL